MSTLNKVMLIGNLTRDPTVRHTAKGTAVAELGLALNRTYTVPDTGERKEEATFIEVVLWDRQAETAGQYLEKGRPVFIEGRLQLDSWQDKETGQNRQKIVVIGERVQFLGGPRNGDGNGENQGEHQDRGDRNYGSKQRSGRSQDQGSYQETRAREDRPGRTGRSGYRAQERREPVAG